MFQNPMKSEYIDVIRTDNSKSFHSPYISDFAILSPWYNRL